MIYLMAKMLLILLFIEIVNSVMFKFALELINLKVSKCDGQYYDN